jgi:hypothetical protein
VKCDILVISGHFAGQFFGSTGFSVDAHDFWDRSCSETCRGLFQDVQEVYLFGCNTLASKVPDPRRSAEDYVRILHEDGLDPGTAQRLSAQRYSSYGLSFGRRMRWIFPNAQTIYGYSGGGPTGPDVAPSLSRFLRGASFEKSLGRTGMIRARGESSKLRSQYCALAQNHAEASGQFSVGLGTLSAAEDLRQSSWASDTLGAPEDSEAIREYINENGRRFPVVAWDLVELGLQRSLFTEAAADRLKESFVAPIARGPQSVARRKLCPILLQSKNGKTLKRYFDIAQCQNTDWL